jgi:NACHT domain/Ankyrin repeats (3 copies)
VTGCLQQRSSSSGQNRDDLESYNGVLWIKGKPGAGKSTLMKHALLHYQESFPNHAIAAYFFNARGDALEKSPLGMFRSLLYQLLEENPQACNCFIPLFLDKQKKHGTHWTWYLGELKSFLLEMIRHQSQPTVLFVDALDECNESEVRDVVSFLEMLSSAAIGSDTSLSICLSSRHYPTISMRKMLELVVETRAEHDRDIAIYVQDKLKMRDEHIESELLRKAAGVFMWIILVTEMLNQAFDEGRIRAMRRKFREVPGDLDEVFRTLLEKDSQYKHETLLMLQWVLFAKRLLKPEELYFAVLAGTEPEDLGPWDQSKVTNQTIERFITTTSRGLIEVRKGDEETVQFIHESVNDFLLRNKRLQTLDIALVPHVIGASHDRLVVCCLSYIKMGVLEPLVKDIAPEMVLAQNYPFLEYASAHILHHAEQAHMGCITQHELLQRLQHEPELFKRLKSFHDIFKHGGSKYGMEAKLLYVTSIHHHQGLTQTILRERCVDVNAQGGYYGNALQAAAAVANDPFATNAIDVVPMLLDAGADVNAQGGHYGNALQAAATENAKDVIQMLMDAGADVNAQGGHYGNALQAAVAVTDDVFATNPEGVVQMLLDAGADVNAQGGYYGNALQAAAAKNAEGIVQMLLDAGADVNAQGGRYGNAL